MLERARACPAVLRSAAALAATLAGLVGVALGACAASLPFAREAHAVIGDSLGLSPFWDWKTIETDHFRVTFPRELEESARKSAVHLEEAHVLMVPKLYWEPWRKTQVLVIDNEDQANGLTAAQLRIGMVLWMTPPDPWYSTAYYDDWLRLLAIHEYAHFLNMDAVRSFYVPLRYLFGDVLLPNASWPTWMLEGLAVYMETRYTRGGRGRSPYYDMIQRTAVAEGVLDTEKFYTLDKINGDTPYSPGGEVPYFFGYQLMNQVARMPLQGHCPEIASLLTPSMVCTDKALTRDGENYVTVGPASHPSEDVLGVMSFRSSRRIPYFINGNLENIAGKDWYDVWRAWVNDSRERSEKQLARIRSRPVTRYEWLTQAEGLSTLGPTPSPDGRWMAYTSDTPDRRQGLYLRDLREGGVRRLDDKSAGTTMAFTPDSRSLVYSVVERRRLYTLPSDLEGYDLDRDRGYRMTHGLRARDPDISPDGKWIAVTLTESQTTGLALAPLSRDPDSGELRLGELRRLSAATRKFDRVSTPRFSRDGKRIYYSVHRNGRLGEDLMAWDIAAGKAVPLVADGQFNRFPAPAPDGSLAFVSDRTGVNNLYHLSAQALDAAVASGASAAEPALISNFESGVTTPAIGPAGELFASVYTSAGWGIARVLPLSGGGSSGDAGPGAGSGAGPGRAAAARPEDITLDPPPAPPSLSESEMAANAASASAVAVAQAPVRDYSAWRTLLPRQWSILPVIYPGGAYFQGSVFGFDAVDRHQYALSVGYLTQTGTLDWSTAYSNRSLGATISLEATQYTSGLDFDETGITDYTRKHVYSARASLPIRWTYSSLTPSIGVGAERIFNHSYGFDPSGDDLVASSPFVPTADFALAFSDVETARLSIAPEAGRTLSGGVRAYADNSIGSVIAKGVLKGTQYFRLWNHSVLFPSAKAMWTSGFDPNYADANAVIRGRTAGLIPDTSEPLFDHFRIRGYPLVRYYSRSAFVGAIDLRVPLWRIYRGLGTNPFFFEQLYAFAFAEATAFPSAPGVPALPSAGGGLNLRTEAFLHIPVDITLEYDQGFRSSYGGKGDVFLAMKVGAISF